MMIVETTDPSVNQRRTTAVSNEDAAKRRREGGGARVLLPLLFQKKPPEICVTVKGPLTEAHGYHGGNSACFAMRVTPFKQLLKGSLRVPSTGSLMKHHSCLRIAHLAKIFDSILMSLDSCHVKHIEKERRQIFIGFPCTKETNLSVTTYLA